MPELKEIVDVASVHSKMRLFQSWDNLPEATQMAYVLIRTLEVERENPIFNEALEIFQKSMNKWRTGGYQGLPPWMRYVDPFFGLAYLREKAVKKLIH